jgi:hypothetical protein
MSRREFGLRKKPRAPTVLDLLHRSSNNRRNRIKQADFIAKPISTPATVPRLLSSNTFTTNTLLVKLDTPPTITSTDSTNVEQPTSSGSDPTSTPATIPRLRSSNTFTTNTLLLELDTTPPITSTDSTNVEQPTSSGPDPISTPATVLRLLNNNTFTTNTLLVELDTTPTITSTDSTNVEPPTSSGPGPILAHFDNVSTTSVDDTITTNTQLITHDTTPTFTVTDPTFTTVELASSSFLDPIPANFNNVSTTTDDETTILTPIEFGIDISPETNMNSFQASTLDPTISVTEPIPSTTPTLFETFPLTVPATNNKNWTNMDSFIPSYNVSENVNVTNTILEPGLKTDLLLNKTVENNPENFFTFVRNFLTKFKILLLVATLIRPHITLETCHALRAALGIVLAG